MGILSISPSPYLSLPASFLFAFAWGITIPNNPFLYRIIACKYYHSQDSPFPNWEDPGADPLPEVCKTDNVEALSSWIVTSVHVVDNALTILCLSLFSKVLTSRGRVFCVSLVAICALLYQLARSFSILLNGPISFTIFAFGSVIYGVAGQPLLMLSLRNFIVDCTETNLRSSFFSILLGIYYASSSLSVLFGGFLISSTSSFLSTYYLSITLYVLLLLYSVIILPETMKPSTEEEGTFKKVWESVNFLRPLKVFGVARGLVWVGIGIFTTRAAGQFTTELILFVLTREYSLNAKQVGLITGLTSALKATFLTFCLPLILLRGRQGFVSWWYGKESKEKEGESQPLLQNEEEDDNADGRIAPVLITDEITQGAVGDELGADGVQCGDNQQQHARVNEIHPDSSNHKKHSSDVESINKKGNIFDLFISLVSYFLDGVAMLLIGLSNNIWQVCASLTLLFLSAGASSSLSAFSLSLLPSHPTSLTTDLLTAIVITDSLADVASPLVLGSVYALGVQRGMGRLVWAVSAVGFWIGMGMIGMGGMRGRERKRE